MNNKQTGIENSIFDDNAQIEANQRINSPRQHQEIPSNMRPGSKNFVGREKELENIHNKLTEGQGVIVCAVEGLGGVGKTELALQYAQHYREEYTAQYWLNLREMGLAQAVVTLAAPYISLPESIQAESIEAQAAWYWQNWLPAQGKLLVILDDVTELKSIPQPARPLYPRFQLLVTTRRRKLSSQFVEIALEVISEGEALQLLRNLLGDARVERELTVAKEICRYLGYLPLGVELAGRYLQIDEDLKLRDYQLQIHIADESLDLQEAEDIGATRGVIAAFELSWQELGETTAQVAMLLGLFDPESIAWYLVEDVAKELNLGEQEIRAARKHLNNLYFLKAVDEERTRFGVHSLVREFMKWKLAQAPATNQTFRTAFVTYFLEISITIDQTPTKSQIQKVAPAIPHLEILSREMLEDIPNPGEDSNLVWAFTGIARFYQGQGLYALALEPYEKCLSSVEKILGADHPDTASSLNNLAVLYRAMGRYSDAEPLFERSLKIDKKVYSEDHPDIATSLNNLANLYYAMGRYSDAEPLHERSLHIWETQLGADHPDTASSLNNLAILYKAMGRYSDAEPLYARSLHISEAQLGADHPHTASSLNNLAELYRVMGRYSDAEPLYKKSLHIWETQLGADHPHTATNLNNLAALYESMGRYSDAEPLYGRSLQIRETQLGADHPDTAASLNNLAGLYYAMGRYSDAEPLYERSLQISETQLGADHPDTAGSLNNLAALYETMGCYSEAEPLHKRSLQIRETQLGKDHPDTANSLNNLAILYQAMGCYSDAEPLFERSLQIRETQLGADHPHTATSLNNLAELYRVMGRYSDAEPFYLRSLQIAETALGRDHPNTKMIREGLQLIRQKQKSPSLTWWQWIAVILLSPFRLFFVSLRWLIHRFVGWCAIFKNNWRKAP